MLGLQGISYMMKAPTVINTPTFALEPELLNMLSTAAAVPFATAAVAELLGIRGEDEAGERGL
eukprot:1640161-Prymnesium_polylepis.1